MSISPLLCRRAVQHGFPPISEHVWISDEMLSAAMRRFKLSRSHRRHGSSVPGPLEASRRLAKRRMMGLAVAGDGVGMDVGAILGMGGELKRGSWQWEAPAVPGSLGKAAPPLPSWLTDFVPSTDEPELRPGLQKSVDGKRLHDQFASRLALHTDVKGIKHLVKELGLELQKVPKLSNLAFKTLLGNNTSHECLIEFLEDPLLNVTAARNFLQYVQHLKGCPSRHSKLADLHQYIKQAVALGLVSEEEIVLVLKDDAKNCMPRELGGALPESNGVGFVRAIWDGLEQSSVFKPENLNGRTLGMIVSLLNLVDTEHRFLAQSIVAAATPAQHELMTKRIAYSFLAWCQYGKVSEVSIRKTSEANGQKLHRRRMTVPGWAEYIDSLPETVVRPSLYTATMILLSQQHEPEVDGGRSRLFFKTWMNLLSRSVQFRSQVLGSPEWETVEQELARSKHTHNITTYLRFFSEFQQCKFIVRSWVQDLLQPETGLEPAKVCSAVMRSFYELCGTRGLARCYNNLILALYHENQLNNRILHDSLWLLRKLSRSDTVIQIVELLQSCNIPVKAAILGAEVEQYSGIDLGVALRIFELHQALALEGCVNLAVALINDPLSHVDITFRLLKRHRPTTDNTPKSTRPRSEARSHLLHEMATAFAHASHLNPSIAFRKVRLCYTHLNRDGLPIRPALARALTHAGIIRCLQAGESVGTEKIQWILSKVREVEGDEVEKVVDEAIYHWRGEVKAGRPLQRPQYNESIRHLLENEVYAAAGNTAQGGQEDKHAPPRHPHAEQHHHHAQRLTDPNAADHPSSAPSPQPPTMTTLTPKPFTIAIAGGGIGGLALLIALHHQHISAHLYEAASSFGEVGAGVSFGPNALRAMTLLSPAVRAAYDRWATGNGWAAKKDVWFDFRHGMQGERVGAMIAEVVAEGCGQSSIHRARFLDELVKLVPAGWASFGKRVVGVVEMELEGAGGERGVRITFADGTSAEASALVGCDGIRSRVRQLVLGETDPAARAAFTGKYAYRGLVPMAAAVELLGDELARNSQMYLGTGGHVLTFPIEGGETMNVVAFRTKRDGRGWEDERWVLPMRREDMERDFEGWGSSVRSILSLMQKPDLWALFDHPEARTYCEGRVCLLGDAAHASTPHQGAGAGMALEDAVVLSRLLGEVRSAEGIEEAFKVYDRVRRPRSQRLVTTSRAAGRLYDFEGEGIGDDEEKVREDLVSRYRWIWEEDLEMHLDEAKASWSAKAKLV